MNLTLDSMRSVKRVPATKRHSNVSFLLGMALRVWAIAAVMPCAPAAIFDLQTATVADIQEAMEAGALTSEKLVQLYLNRIDAYDKRGPKINAIITLNPRALNEARALDAERKAKGPRSQLHGVPVLFKDLIDVAGLPTTAGFIPFGAPVPYSGCNVGWTAASSRGRGAGQGFHLQLVWERVRDAPNWGDFEPLQPAAHHGRNEQWERGGDGGVFCDAGGGNGHQRVGVVPVGVLRGHGDAWHARHGQPRRDHSQRSDDGPCRLDRAQCLRRDGPVFGDGRLGRRRFDHVPLDGPFSAKRLVEGIAGCGPGGPAAWRVTRNDLRAGPPTRRAGRSSSRRSATCARVARW